MTEHQPPKTPFAQTTRLIRLPRVIEMTGLLRSAIYAGMRDGRFPCSVKLTSRAVAWREHEILAWIANPTKFKSANQTQQHRKTHTHDRWIAVGAMVEHTDDKAPDICSCNPSHFGQEGRSYEEQCANARLIAQAPNMLQALRDLLACMEGLEVTDGEAEALERADQIIAMATGETRA